VLRHGSHSFTCKLHHACLDSPAAEHHRPLAGTHFTVSRRVEGWVNLSGWLHTEIKCRLRESARSWEIWQMHCTSLLAACLYMRMIFVLRMYVAVCCRRHLMHIRIMRVRCGRCVGLVKVSGCPSGSTAHCAYFMPTLISTCRTSMLSLTLASYSVIDLLSFCSATLFCHV